MFLVVSISGNRERRARSGRVAIWFRRIRSDDGVWRIKVVRSEKEISDIRDEIVAKWIFRIQWIIVREYIRLIGVDYVRVYAQELIGCWIVIAVDSAFN